MNSTVALFLTSSVLVVGCGQSPQGKDVVTVVKEADEATAATAGVEYRFRIFGAGDLAEHIPERTGFARLLRTGEWEEAGLWVEIYPPGTSIVEGEGEGRPEPILTVVSDGTTAHLLDSEGRRHLHANRFVDGDEFIRLAGPAIMFEFVHPSPFHDEMEADSLQLEGMQEIGGVMCDIVYVVYRDGVAESRWFFGPDHLPRRVERMREGEGWSGAQVLELHAMKVRDDMRIEGFSIEPPEGFTSERYERELPFALPVGSEAPDWTLRRTDGDEVRLSEWRGSVVVLDFWDDECPDCPEWMRMLERLHGEFRERNVRFLGVHLPIVEPEGDQTDLSPPASVEARAREIGMTYDVLLGDVEIARAYRVIMTPMLYIIGADGRITYSDEIPDEEVEERVRAAIEAALKG